MLQSSMTCFTSGQIPLTLDGTIVSDDVQEQTKQVLET